MDLRYADRLAHGLLALVIALLVTAHRVLVGLWFWQDQRFFEWSKTSFEILAVLSFLLAMVMLVLALIHIRDKEREGNAGR